jgi:hypothetical protein
MRTNLAEQRLSRSFSRSYFENMQPVALFLDPRLHTVSCLDKNSPLLLAVICASASVFCRELVHKASSLQEMALKGLVQIYIDGSKSRSIVQAICMLAHWAPLNGPRKDDRTWTWTGQAMWIRQECSGLVECLADLFDRSCF